MEHGARQQHEAAQEAHDMANADLDASRAPLSCELPGLASDTRSSKK